MNKKIAIFIIFFLGLSFFSPGLARADQCFSVSGTVHVTNPWPGGTALISCPGRPGLCPGTPEDFDDNITGDGSTYDLTGCNCLVNGGCLTVTGLPEGCDVTDPGWNTNTSLAEYSINACYTNDDGASTRDITITCPLTTVVTCSVSREYNECCALGLSRHIVENICSDGTYTYGVGECSQTDSSCASSIPPPSVKTQAATSITQTSATLNSTINPNGSATVSWFRWGTSNTACTSLPNPTIGNSKGSGVLNVSDSYSLTGLTSGTTYYFCALANNDGGTATGNVLSFTATTPTHYACSGSYCVDSSTGPYTTSNCNNACTSSVGGGPTPPSNVTLSCDITTDPPVLKGSWDFGPYIGGSCTTGPYGNQSCTGPSYSPAGFLAPLYEWNGSEKLKEAYYENPFTGNNPSPLAWVTCVYPNCYINNNGEHGLVYGHEDFIFPSGLAQTGKFYSYWVASLWSPTPQFSWWRSNGILSPKISCGPPPTIPNDPTFNSASCPAPGTSATISWNPPTTGSPATFYDLRVDDLVNGYGIVPNGPCGDSNMNPGDYCINGYTSTSFTWTTVANHTYNWWVHACNSAGCSPGLDPTDLYCTPPAPDCNSGSCSTCTAPANTCSTSNGTETCTYTTYTGGGSCNPVTVTQPCTINNCSSGLTCTSGQCTLPPWIQTTGGDVHSNTNISTPGGP